MSFWTFWYWIFRFWLLRQKPIYLLPKVIWRSGSNHRYLKSCMAIMDVITNNYARDQISSSTSSYLARKLFDWPSYWYWLEMECKMHKCRFFIFFVIVAVDAVIMHISEQMTKGGRHVFCVIVKYHHIYFKAFMVS